MFYFFLFLSLSSSRIMSKGFISPLFLPLLIREEAASHQQRQAQQNSISNNSTRTGLNVTRCTQQHTHGQTGRRTRKHVVLSTCNLDEVKAISDDVYFSLSASRLAYYVSQFAQGLIISLFPSLPVAIGDSFRFRLPSSFVPLWFLCCYNIEER